MKILLLVLLIYSSTVSAHDLRTPEPVPKPVQPTPTTPEKHHDSKLVPLLIGALLGTVLVMTFGKEKKEPAFKIKSSPGDDR